VQGGCDYQFAALGTNLVIGAFGDYDFSSLKGQLPLGLAYGTEKMSSAWAVGGRIGWIALPGLLTYFSGGYTQATFDRVDFFPLVVGAPPVNNFIGKATYNGWFLGAGDEYALSFLPGLFWKSEYRFSQFDRKTNIVYDSLTGLRTPGSADSEKWVHTVRSELVYRFNWGGPVVAKY
jgi:outer membrane immunogenic protein